MPWEMDAIAKNFGEVEAVEDGHQSRSWFSLDANDPSQQSRFDQDWYHCQCSGRCRETGDISEERLNESVRGFWTSKKTWVLNFDPSARTAEKAEEAVGSTLNPWTPGTQDCSGSGDGCKNEDNTCHLRLQTGDQGLTLGAFENEVPGLDLGHASLNCGRSASKRYLLCGQELHLKNLPLIV